MTQITEAFKKDFSKVLGQKSVKANEHLDSLLAVLREHKLLYRVEKIQPCFFLVHKANRGGLLLSPHNVHRNAARIHSCGADMRQLTNAVCVEMGLNSTLRWEHIAKNRQLVDRANGLLAPLNGAERYLSLGCGHTVAFCKQAAVQGCTSQKSLQCSDSDKIDLQSICQNVQFKTMIEEGWSWDVVPAVIDELWPSFATVAQKALNTQNHIGTEVGELETCMTLASSVYDPGMRELSGWKELAIENVVALNVPSAKYSKTLLEFVLNYGGGEGAPLITFMDDVAKQFGCNVNLGQGFWEALENTVFNSKTCLFPLVRVSLALTNMTGDKVEDGVARLLGKPDVAKVASKTRIGEATEAEAILGEAMQIANTLGGMDVVLHALGQMFVRVGLCITGKEKLGREQKVYKLGDICDAYLGAVSDIKKQTVTFAEWDKHEKTKSPAKAKAQPSAKASSSAPVPPMATLSDHKDPKWIAQKYGFNIGTYVVQKNVEHPTQYFIVTISNDVAIQQVCSYESEPHKASITLDDLIGKWSVSKADPPKQMDGDQQRPLQLQVDKHKAALFQALIGLDAKHCGKHKLVFWRKPDEVRTVGAIKEGQLTLVPVAQILNISSKNNPSSSGIPLGDHPVGGKSVPFFLIPLPKPPSDTTSKFDVEAIVAAYWWVGPTPDKKHANMAMSTVSHGGFMLPVMTNTVDIAPNSKLLQYVKPKARAAPIHTAETAKKQKKA